MIFQAKTIFVTIVLLVSSFQAFAQGQLVFNNRIGSLIDAPVDFMGADPVGMKSQLYLVGSQGALTPLTPVTTFRTGNPLAFRYVAGTTVFVPGVAPGSSATFRMVAYDGVDFESSLFRGYSEAFTISNIGGDTLPPSNLIGLTGFSIVPASEATTLAVNGSSRTLWNGPGSTAGNTSGTTTGGTNGGTVGTTTGSSDGGATGSTNGSVNGGTDAGTTGSTSSGGTTGSGSVDFAPEVVPTQLATRIRIGSGSFALSTYTLTLWGHERGTFLNSDGFNGSGSFVYQKTGTNQATLTLNYAGSHGLDQDSMQLTFSSALGGTFQAVQRVSASGTTTVYENVQGEFFNWGIGTGGTSGGTTGSSGNTYALLHLNNRIGSMIDAPVDFMGAAPTGMKAQLYVRSGNGILTPVGPVTTFRTGSPAAYRYILPVDVELPGFAPQSSVTVRMVAYDGVDFDSSLFRGYSDEVFVGSAGGSMLPPANLDGLRGFSILHATEANQLGVSGSPRTLWNGPGSTGGNTHGTTTGGTNGNTDGGTDGSSTSGETTGTSAPNFAPERLAANSSLRVRLLNSPFGLTTYTLNLAGNSSSVFQNSDGFGGRGNYTYERTGTNQAELVLTYSHTSGVGRHNISLQFASATSGTFTGTQTFNMPGGGSIQYSNVSGEFFNWGSGNGGTTGGSTTGATGDTAAHVRINNKVGTSIDAPINFKGMPLPSGFKAQLYLVRESGIVKPVGPVTFFYAPSTGSSDYPVPVTFALEGIAPGTAVNVRLVAFDGVDFESSSIRGYSDLVTIPALGSSASPSHLIGLTSFSVVFANKATNLAVSTAPRTYVSTPDASAFWVHITGGPFAPATYSVVLAGGNSGTFYITHGSEGSGNYTLSQSELPGTGFATLTLNYTNPAGGDRDVMHMMLHSHTSGSFTGVQQVSGPGGTLTSYNNFAGIFQNFTLPGGGTTGGTSSGTTGSLPAAPDLIPNNTSLRVQVSGGPYTSTYYSLTLSGGNSGNFNLSDGTAGNGNYLFVKTGPLKGTLTLNYANPTPGEQDVMHLDFGSASAGRFAGLNKIVHADGSVGVYEDFAGTFSQWNPPSWSSGGGTTGGTDGGVTGGLSSGTNGSTTGGTDGGNTGGVSGGSDGGLTSGATTGTDGATTGGLSGGASSGTNGSTTGNTTGGLTAGTTGVTGGQTTAADTTSGTTSGNTIGGATGGQTGGASGQTNGSSTSGGETTMPTTLSITLQPGFNLVANPFRGLDNRISHLFRLLPEGTKIYKYDGAGFMVATKNEIFEPSAAATTEVLPGEGVFVFNPTQAPVSLTFGGIPMSGVLTNALPAGLSIRSSMAMRDGTAAELGLPMEEGDQIFQLDATTQRYKTWTYDAMVGGRGGFMPAGQPFIKAGEAFYLRKNRATDWVQTPQ